MKSETPYTIGYKIDQAILMLDGYMLNIEETSTPYDDKKEERKENTPIVVRQLRVDDCIHLTVTRFK